MMLGKMFRWTILAHGMWNETILTGNVNECTHFAIFVVIASMIILFFFSIWCRSSARNDEQSVSFSCKNHLTSRWVCVWLSCLLVDGVRVCTRMNWRTMSMSALVHALMLSKHGIYTYILNLKLMIKWLVFHWVNVLRACGSA